MKAHSEAIAQYIDLYRQNESTLTDSPFGFLRPEALNVLERALTEGVDETEVADMVRLEHFLAPDYGINLRRNVLSQPDLAAAFRCGVPRLNAIVIAVCDDRVLLPDNLADRLPEGVEIASLRVVAATRPDFVQKYLGTLADGSPATALNSLFLSDGILIHVPAGVKMETPVQIVNLSGASIPTLNVRRTLVVAEEYSAVRVLLCDHTTQGAAAGSLSLAVEEVFAGTGAVVEVYDIEETDSEARRLRHLYARQYDNSHITVGGFSLSGGLTRNDYTVDIAGDHTETDLCGLGLGSGSRILSNRILLSHNGHHGTSRQLFKNALFDQSRGDFSGKIIVAPGATFTDASQTNRNLLCSEGARMSTAPQLEIYCDEVKCSHGATTGQLDELALFYMQTRGIPRDEARRMLTQAFMADVVDMLSFEVLRQRLHLLVDARLSGHNGNCETCRSACHEPTEEL